ncbi:hypothetical protein N7494_005062 [Penicillium frequentans]|uniref:Uncharacterized protein n=1 Tax=Penicillium frequentans TaxID=3151616 RepID=A0AAD6GF24_9EURO|nr:hypothetical protein N7494_005062 [Penicillium glabrum]
MSRASGANECNRDWEKNRGNLSVDFRTLPQAPAAFKINITPGWGGFTAYLGISVQVQHLTSRRLNRPQAGERIMV